MSEMNATVDPAEVARFDALGAQWWDEKGKMAPLHAMNPARLAFLRDALVRHFSRDARALRPLKGLSILDIGCGGGLLSEPLARMGGQVRGIDPAPGNVDIARTHAAASGLAVDYEAVTAEELASRGDRFDVVVALEVVEHVADVSLFVRTAGQLVADGGVLVLSTLNRTAKSFALAIVGAEYVLRWLPPGTHRWEKFITPEELEATLAAAGFTAREKVGLAYEPFSGDFHLIEDLSVNYFMVAERVG
ncbi:UNVERIFIED_ORG: 2-polyprenyl-6-hydroxyphenyl methylase/3-demethylubiquinone-9 3-methyltransferase [Xanthobacter viscosus]|jgi:2-polyprenyl-6-hydroxyphenyl methylase/3-demethylubiquinone-9 3-methyltransferase|uniref:Ubiquinone biosynthesis O-methyltransferase n=1 Tax=Xanthobacter autotrophicus TaxID=280 RepID=A0A6C1KDR1_XANAU|nr:bifunctional 2-polyprenyl-6-hydroxyphenol methylase/3-demethylubiquinol 3-O-methyltransferase UbiG [Xanthobacter autotrophicus]TLX42395.1 bifunctional 2-polyprenyl-6-hydroxyphenol methylase/3-demethylubiquinol 3-O-methyltransferase UbiG [Xanthobacter autotrophicus]